MLKKAHVSGGMRIKIGVLRRDSLALIPKDGIVRAAASGTEQLEPRGNSKV